MVEVWVPGVGEKGGSAFVDSAGYAQIEKPVALLPIAAPPTPTTAHNVAADAKNSSTAATTSPRPPSRASRALAVVRHWWRPVRRPQPEPPLAPGADVEMVPPTLAASSPPLTRDRPPRYAAMDVTVLIAMPSDPHSSSSSSSSSRHKPSPPDEDDPLDERLGGEVVFGLARLACASPLSASSVAFAGPPPPPSSNARTRPPPLEPPTEASSSSGSSSASGSGFADDAVDGERRRGPPERTF
ncbi:hypothetical protein PUNSTDRAFT_52900 [Punctularia strigosozonata HHB-11173 SS5]|uniref:uncharacterized protein n=1 Tax=Punctularia strigosozonata (strain HHB-11173) TaxID=741275 RepID=UPI00044169FE|nr:uncharacterized protein PUNSTDRAFT_52900 [Punctularia strigosozonata HHB-11173 SS5]EIN08517.1 hypothetical protein PUNSTDRAFT_52900 [Punctularia strigosozonata HHB-11173 SS5]